MADKKKKDNELVREWQAKIKWGLAAQKAADERYGYSASILQYQGRYEEAIPSWIGGVPLIPINEVYAYTKAFIPSVYSRNPRIFFNPVGGSHIASSKILELSVNGYWRDLRLKKVVKKVIFDAIFAEGWVKTGYFAETERGSDDEAPDLEPSEFVKREDIFAVRVPWQNIIRDPDAVEGIDDARWVAHRIVKPLEAVKGSSLFDLAADAEATHVFRPGTLPNNLLAARPAEDPGEIQYIVFWEIWDRDTQKVYAISEQEGHGHLWTPKDWPYEMEGFPFIMLRFNENQNEAYAPNLISPWVPQLWEKMKIRAMQLDHLKRFGRQMQVEDNGIEAAEENKFTQGITGALIKTKAGKKIEPIPYPAVQTDMYAVESRIDLDKDNVSGQPNAVRSAPQKTQSRTLGEIDRLISAFQARQGEPQDIVEEFCAELAIKLASLMKQYLSGEQFVRASQEEAQVIIEAFGAERFDGTGFKFTKKDIKDCEFEVNVKCGSALPIDTDKRMESSIQLLKLGPTIGVQPLSETASVLGKTLMEDMEMKEVELAFQRDIEKMRATEQALMAAEEAKLNQKQMQVNNVRASRGA